MVKEVDNSKRISKENIFDAAILFHLKNLGACASYMDSQGRVYRNKKTLIEGVSENPYTSGFLLVYDGPTVLEKAEEMILRKRNGIKDPVKTETVDDLVNTLQNDPDKDATYFLNTGDRTVTKVKGELSNTPPEGEDIESLLESYLPNDFLSTDPIQRPVYEAGNKTAIAIVAARRISNVKVVLAKNTSYGNTGLGVVAELGSEGLERRFFFRYDPEHKGEFIDPERKLVGVYQEFRKTSEGIELTSEKYVTLEPGRNLKYHSSTPVTAAPPAASYGHSSFPMEQYVNQ